MKYEFTRSNLSFQSLEVNIFCAGELDIIGNAKIKEAERSGRINLLTKSMYLNTSYDFKTLKSYYVACLITKLNLATKPGRMVFNILSQLFFQSMFQNKVNFLKSSNLKPRKILEIRNLKIKCGFVLCTIGINALNRAVILKPNLVDCLAHHVCATCWQKDGKNT